MRRLTVLMMTAIAACLLAGGVLASGASADPTTTRWGGYYVLTDSEKQEKMFDILDRFVTRAETVWDTNTGIRESAGYYNTLGSGMRTDRGNAEMAYILAVLLLGRSSQTDFGVNDEVPRATLISRLENALRFVAFTNRNVGGTGWGSVTGAFDWQASFIASQAAFAGYLGSSATGVRYDSATIPALNRALEYEAEWIRTGAPDRWDRGDGDSGAEETQGYSNSVAAAAALMPGHGTASRWRDAAKRFSYNSVGRDADESDSTVMDGDTVANWVEWPNLFDDYTMENHGIMHPAYLTGVVSGLAENELVYYFTGQAAFIPAAFRFRRQEIWDNVVASLLNEDGDLVQPSGNDWAKHDYQHLGYLSGMAGLLSGDDQKVASVIESRALVELERRQLAEGGGSLLGTGRDIGYEIDIARLSALGALMHSAFPAPEPTEAEFEAAWDDADGVRHWSGNEVIAMKGPNAVASMSWQNDSATEPMALIMPNPRNRLDDPVGAQAWFGSGINQAGAVSSYSCDCASAGYFSTAAIVDGGTDNWYSMTSWADDGTTLLLDRGTGETFGFAFENYRGIAGRRPVHTETGTKSNTTFTGDWANVEDRFGLIVKGGAGMETFEDSDTNVRSDLFDPHVQVLGSTGTGSGNRAAVVLPTATAAQTRTLAADADQGSTGDANWSAASARGLDGRARIAVARWGGSGTTTVSGLTSTLGAPIADRNADITVNAADEASMSVTLGSPESVGWRGFFFVQTDQSVTVRPQSGTRIKLTVGGSQATVTVHYVDDTGVAQNVRRTLSPGTVIYAEAVGGELTMPVASATTEDTGFPATRAVDFDAATYWVSRSVNLTTNPQDLTVDFGREIEVGKVVMNPRSNLGPRDYEIKYAPTGCSAYTSAQRVTTASATATTTTTLSTPVKAQCVRITITSQYGGGPPGQVQVEDLTVAPTDVDVDVLEPAVNLARSGWNSAKVRVRNNTGSSTRVTVGTSLSGATGVTASVSPSSTPTVPANGYADVYVELAATGTTPTTGTGTLTVSATGARSETSTLEFTSNLALNDNGTRFPAAVSSSQDAGWNYGPHWANNGDTVNDFWVSDAVSSLSSSPQCLFIDLGRAVSVGRVTMTPRTNYGPRDYVVQTYSGLGPSRECANDSSWTTQATVTGLTNGVARDSTWRAVSTRWVRIKITAQHGSGPPFQVQVRELAAYGS